MQDVRRGTAFGEIMKRNVLFEACGADISGCNEGIFCVLASLNEEGLFVSKPNSFFYFFCLNIILVNTNSLKKGKN